MDMVPSYGGGIDHSADFDMADMEAEAAKKPEMTTESVPITQTQSQAYLRET